MTKALPRPTESELEILKILWAKGPLTVRQIHEKLQNGTGYTTALKLLQIMADKGLAQRDESAKAHIYTAVLAQADAQRDAVSTLASKLFGGSGLKLAMQALTEERANTEELAEIKRLLSQMEQPGKKR